MMERHLTGGVFLSIVRSTGYISRRILSVYINAWNIQEGTERFSKIRQKHNKDFVMGYAFNLCKNQILIVPCNYKFR